MGKFSAIMASTAARQKLWHDHRNTAEISGMITQKIFRHDHMISASGFRFSFPFSSFRFRFCSCSIFLFSVFFFHFPISSGIFRADPRFRFPVIISGMLISVSVSRL